MFEPPNRIISTTILVALILGGGCVPEGTRPKAPVPWEPIFANPNEITRRVSQPPQVPGTSPEDIDLGETGCDKSFTQATTPEGAKFKYYLAEFPEVVWINNAGLTKDLKKGSQGESCTGTLIGSSWVLTAAHCFVDEDRGTKPGDDTLLWPRPDAHDVQITAGAAVWLAPKDRDRVAEEIIVHAAYGKLPDETIRNDLAVIKLRHPYPTKAIPPARLATRFEKNTTILGYGYQNRDGGHLYHLGIGWPAPVKQNVKLGLIKFVPTSGDAFCQGDSGGPVFAARLRGCRVHDLAGEPHPHPIEGVMSYVSRTTAVSEIGTVPQGVFDWQTIRACETAAGMTVQDITGSVRHTWICSSTQGLADGCTSR